MQRINHRQRSIIAFIGIVLCIGGSLTKTLAQTELTDKENTVIETLFEKTKPQCIGRYVIDVPESFNNQLNDDIYIDDFKIKSRFIYPPAFKQRIELREKELREAINRPENEMNNAPYLKEVIQLPDGKGVIFDRNEPGADDAYRVLEAHLYVDHIAFIITTEIRDFSDKKYEKRKASFLARGGTEVQSNQKPIRLAAMYSLISRLSGRLDHEIPTDKGICIPNGFILDDNDKHQQKIAIVYKNDELLLFLESDNRYLGSNDTLLNREKEINEAMKQQALHTIKKGNLSISNIPAQEWLMTGNQETLSKEKNIRISNLPYYDFWFFANEATSTEIIPLLHIGMNNRNKFTSYSDAEMVEIWDRIVGSLRYKPNAF
ncbi:T6SS immunity protein Tli4 family protein [Providencia rettgeri]|uniref:T6SS immunity protein Tli4 family protein n=2 Tax=Providencia TaxID=586 RepID=UPI0032D9B4FB